MGKKTTFKEAVLTSPDLLGYQLIVDGNAEGFKGFRAHLTTPDDQRFAIKPQSYTLNCELNHPAANPTCQRFKMTNSVFFTVAPKETMSHEILYLEIYNNFNFTIVILFNPFQSKTIIAFPLDKNEKMDEKYGVEYRSNSPAHKKEARPPFLKIGID